MISQSNIFVLQGIAIECRKIVQKDKAVAKQKYIMSIDINVLEVLKWEYAAFQAAVLVLFKTLLSLSLSHA